MRRRNLSFIFPALFILIAYNYTWSKEFSTNELSSFSIGERIAFWAGRFIGVPYDPDPVGEYVRRGMIVSDERVDCMYHVFRSVELALSSSPEEAVDVALRMRFSTRGILKDGKVINYEDRYQYGEDMIDSGKWGAEITSKLGSTIKIKGSRGRDEVFILPKKEAMRREVLSMFKDGDIVFFIKDPKKRIAGEIVGHIGIIKIKKDIPFLIHASGVKDNEGRKGSVIEIRLVDYLRDMRFVGVRVMRF